MRVICRCGFDAASTEAIVKEAGLTNGALYVHFPAKSELLAAALDYQLTLWNEGISSLDLQGGDPIDGMLKLYRDWDRRISGSVIIVEALAAARRDATLGKLFKRHALKLERTHTEWLRHGQASGNIRADLDARAIARLLSSIGTGYGAQLEAGIPAIDRKAWVRLLEHVLEGLRP